MREQRVTQHMLGRLKCVKRWQSIRNPQRLGAEEQSLLTKLDERVWPCDARNLAMILQVELFLELV